MTRFYLFQKCGPVLGTYYLKIDWFAPKTGLGIRVVCPQNGPKRDLEFGLFAPYRECSSKRVKKDEHAIILLKPQYDLVKLSYQV